MSGVHTEGSTALRGLISWFANNHVAANIMMMLFIVGGFASMTNMRTETFPQIDPRLIVVTVAYPGATPYEVADSITNRVEESLIGIQGIDRISATATEGYGVVNVELEDFANADDVYNDVETAVNALVEFPPEDAERPKITKIKITPGVMNLAIHGEVPEETLKYWAETIEDELRLLDGVAKTSLRGIRDYQISVEIAEDTLRRYGLTLQDVGNAINQFSLDVPAGTIESSQGDILLRIQERRYIGSEFENIIIRTLPDGTKLRLGDIGTVVDGFEDINLISKFNGEPAAFIDVSRNETNDTLAVADEIKQYLNEVELPAGLSLSIQQDQTVILKERISLMMRNAILGFMLVFLILLLFLDLKLAFWTSAAIPISFLGGMLILNMLGFSMNMITLFALIVVLGIVVDDAIIIGESIYEAQENDREDKNAVLKGVSSVLAPVTVGVTTTMAAFAPLIFSTGTLGQIIMVIPVVVIAILFISLLEAYFILPSHLSNSKRWSKGIMRTMRNKFANGLHKFIENVIDPFARFCISWRYATVALFVAFAIFTGAMVKTGNVRFIFFPQIEGDEVTVSVTMPEGTPFETTQEAMLFIEEQTINVLDEVSPEDYNIAKSLSLSIGQISSEANPVESGRSNTSSNIGQLKIELVSSDFRTKSASEIERMIRERVQDLPNVEKMEFQSSLVHNEADINIELTHAEEDILIEAADTLKQEIEKVKGTKEVTDSFDAGKAEYVFQLTDEGLAVGLTPGELGRQLRFAFFGLEAQRFQRGRSEMIVYVRYPKEERENVATLANTRIRLADGSEVPLNEVASISRQAGYSAIETVNGRRIVSVTSDVDYAVTTPNDVIEILNTDILPALEKRYSGLSYSYEGQTREQAEDMASLGRNMAIALLIIYVLLGSQLRSYIQPLLIMTAIPFGVIGAIWGHYLLGHDLTFISMFGIVALTGVVVNDSVVLIDFFNSLRQDGMETYEAAISAIKRRFRPILLTTATTSLGLLPVLLETSLQAQFLIPMVISLATGIIFATVIILILIPNLVMILEDIKTLPERFRSKETQTAR